MNSVLLFFESGSVMIKMDIPKEEFLAPGHRGCAGCGASIAVRLALKALGKDTVAVSATGCLEVMTTPYPETSWEIPWIHVAFENAGAVASGVESALRIQGKKSNVIAFGGDGGTVDIGLQSLSGAMERGHNMTYVCYDNEAYMNTGIQRSGATPFGASTTTSPAGKASFGENRPKKNMPMIMAAHGIPYVATASIAYPEDYMKKVKKAAEVDGGNIVEDGINNEDVVNNLYKLGFKKVKEEHMEQYMADRRQKMC